MHLFLRTPLLPVLLGLWCAAAQTASAQQSATVGGTLTVNSNGAANSGVTIPRVSGATVSPGATLDLGSGANLTFNGTIPGTSQSVPNGSLILAGTSTYANPLVLNPAGSSTPTRVPAWPIFLPPSAPNGPGPVAGQPGVPFAYLLRAYNELTSSEPVTYSATGLPPGLGLDPATGLISGTPKGISPTSSGLFQVRATATNVYASSSVTLTFKIASVPMLPHIVPVQAEAVGTVGSPFSYRVRTRIESPLAVFIPSTHAAYGLPPGLTIDAATGLISGEAEAAGTFPVALTATSAYGFSTGVLTLQIAESALPTVNVRALPVPSVVGGSTTFLLTRTGDVSSELVVYYTLGGKADNGIDYRMLGGSKTIKAGQSSARITLQPRGDFDGKAQKGVRLTLEPADAYLVGDPATARLILHPPVGQ